ncbi:MAG: GNAT family N-acetyltransferase, partial [Pseudomonadota bacterium]
MAVVITTASKVSAEAMHAAMLRGFSDYVVPMQPTFAQFETMLARRSFVPALSFVAEEGGEVVAIWLVGRRGDRGYLIASATAPEARGQGLARGLAERSFEALGAAGVSAMQTEVIKGNAAATALYLGLGFEVSRELSCFALPRNSAPPAPARALAPAPPAP